MSRSGFGFAEHSARHAALQCAGRASAISVRQLSTSILQACDLPAPSRARTAPNLPVKRRPGVVLLNSNELLECADGHTFNERTLEGEEQDDNGYHRQH